MQNNKKNNSEGANGQTRKPLKQSSQISKLTDIKRLKLVNSSIFIAKITIIACSRGECTTTLSKKDDLKLKTVWRIVLMDRWRVAGCPERAEQSTWCEIKVYLFSQPKALH